VRIGTVTFVLTLVPRVDVPRHAPYNEKIQSFERI